MSSEAHPSGAGDSAPSVNDVITAREQRSHIAIIQMAPPAPGSSSSTGKSAASGPSAAATASATATSKPNARGTRGGGERPEKEPKKKKRHHCSVQGCTYNKAHTKDLARHMRKHTGEKPYRCDRCPKRFTRYDKLVMHIRIHEGHKPFSCPCCDYAAIDSSSLRKHIRTHSDERPYKCQLCPYSSKDSSQLVVHVRSHTGDSPYLCTFAGCEAAFKTPSDLTRHSRLHTGEKPYKCLYCDYRAAVKSNLNSHMKRHTNPSRNLRNKKKAKDAEEPEEDEDDLELDPESQDDNQAGPSSSDPPSSLPFQYACKFCDYKADTIEIFGEHMEEFHPESSNTHRKKRSSKRLIREPHNFVCSSCPATFISEGSLRCHMRQHGTVPNKPANVDPGIYSPPPPSASSRSRVQRNLPVHVHRDHNHEETTHTHAQDESYRLHELQRMPAVHNSVITENPSVITNASANSSISIPVPQPVQGPGNITQHHHYDPDTGHLYVITYNNIGGGEEAGPGPANYFMEN